MTRRFGQGMWQKQLCGAVTAMTCVTACTPQADKAPNPADGPIPIAQLARAAEREVGAIMEIQDTDRATRIAMGAVNVSLVKSGLARGLPTLPAAEDAEACFRGSAAGRGLQITSAKSTVVPGPPAVAQKLKPGERWQIKREELFGRVSLEIVVDGPLPSIATLIDEVSHCSRLVIVRDAKVVGNTVTLTADTWYERALPTPELDLRWRSLDERLVAAGWKPDDPALAKEPEMKALKSAVDAGREMLPRARALLKTSSELPRWITRAREMLVLKQEVEQVKGRKLLKLSDG